MNSKILIALVLTSVTSFAEPSGTKFLPVNPEEQTTFGALAQSSMRLFFNKNVEIADRSKLDSGKHTALKLPVNKILFVTYWNRILRVIK